MTTGSLVSITSNINKGFQNKHTITDFLKIKYNR